MRRVITYQDIPPSGELQVPPGTVITPSARDLATERGVTIAVLPADQIRSLASPEKTVAIGSDHGGFRTKEQLKPLFAELGLAIRDVGVTEETPVDYPDIALQVAELVASGVASRGVIIDGAGIGSAMAAEIGSMQVYQEIDALRTMNINPVHYLVLPRLVAITISLPVLVLFAVLIGWFGGGLVSVYNEKIGITFQAFFINLKLVVDLGDVLNGLFKSFVFAIVIGLVSCHQGLVTSGGPRGIGRSVTKAVVNSIVLILILDYFLTRFLLYLEK